MMSRSPERLREIIAARTATAPPPAVAAMADAVRARHGDGVMAVLAYGSCLRDTSVSDSLIDLYVLTRDRTAISGNPLSRLACGLVPPNVYYDEAGFGGATVRCKYAVLTLDAFLGRLGANTDNPYFWARFAQPSLIVWSAGPATTARLVDGLTMAAETFVAAARTALDAPAEPDGLWIAGLKATYATELRSEGAGRGEQIVGFEPDYYRSVVEAVAGPGPVPPAPEAGRWARRRLTGKLLSVARLVKAAFTFQGGADYLAWKIERHSGEPVTLTDWQRRHPIVAAVVWLPRLLRRGAVK